MHDASGCNSTYNTHDEPRWYDMDSLVFISGLSELEAVLGDDEKLIEELLKRIFVIAVCVILILALSLPTMGLMFLGGNQ